MFRRGFVHRTAATTANPTTTGLLVLTRDEWNDHLSAVGVVPLEAARAQPPRFPLRVPVGVGHAVVERISIVQKDLLDTVPIAYVSPDDVALASDALAELIGLPDLRAGVRRPPTPPGPTNYPLWGQVFYGPGTPEPKRYVIVSANTWNRDGRALAVRLTSSTRRFGEEFPNVHGGGAVCAEVQSFVTTRFTSRQRIPPDVSDADMRAIIDGIAFTHRL